MFLRTKESQIKLTQALHQERQSKLEKEIEDIWKELFNAKDFSEEKLRKLEQEKAELSVRYQLLTEKVQDLERQLKMVEEEQVLKLQSEKANA